MHAAADGQREVVRRSSNLVNARRNAPDIYQVRAPKFIFDLFLALCNADTPAKRQAPCKSWWAVQLRCAQRDALVRACRRHTRAARLPSCSHCLTEHLLRACHSHQSSNHLQRVVCPGARNQVYAQLTCTSTMARPGTDAGTPLRTPAPPCIARCSPVCRDLLRHLALGTSAQFCLCLSDNRSLR